MSNLTNNDKLVRLDDVLNAVTKLSENYEIREFVDGWNKSADTVKRKIESIQPVETLDDAIKDWNSEYKLYCFAGEWIAECSRKNMNGWRTYKSGGETPLEAVKRLEEELSHHR